MFAGLAIGSALALALFACGGHDHNSYPSFQNCYDEHTGGEGLTPTQSITICTLEHPINGKSLDFATSAECVTYVTANLATGAATSAEIMAGCDEYIVQKAM